MSVHNRPPIKFRRDGFNVQLSRPEKPVVYVKTREPIRWMVELRSESYPHTYIICSPSSYPYSGRKCVTHASNQDEHQNGQGDVPDDLSHPDRTTPPATRSSQHPLQPTLYSKLQASSSKPRPVLLQPLPGTALATTRSTSSFQTTLITRIRLQDDALHHAVYTVSESSSPPSPRTVPPQQPRISLMENKSQQPKGKDGVISTLNGLIEVLNIAKEIASNTPAKAAFGSVVIILTMVKVSHLLAFCYIESELKYA